MSLRERFEAKYEPGEGVNGCWVWTASLTWNGYGQIRRGNTMAYAHRISYEVHVEEIPSGLQIDHLCRNRACVNPAHLEAVTPRENTLRGQSPAAAHARKTHCPQGHPYSGSNLYTPPSGSRVCRACRRAYRAKYKRAKGRGVSH